MAQWVKGSCLQAWNAEFNTWGPHGSSRESSTTSCPLTSMYIHYSMYIHTHTQISTYTNTFKK